MPANRLFMLHGKASRRSRLGSLQRDVVGVQTGNCLIDTIPECMRRVLNLCSGAGRHRVPGVDELRGQKPDDGRDNQDNQDQRGDTSSVVSRGFLLPPRWVIVTPAPNTQ